MYTFKRIRRFFRKSPRPVDIPEFVPILEELAQAWRAITDDDLLRTETQLADIREGDTKIATVQSQEARRLLALANLFLLKNRQAQLAAQGCAHNKEESALYLEQGQRFSSLEDCARTLWWAQAKDDVGKDAWIDGVGIRKNWMLVKSAEQQGFPGFLRSMTGG